MVLLSPPPHLPPKGPPAYETDSGDTDKKTLFPLHIRYNSAVSSFHSVTLYETLSQISIARDIISIPQGTSYADFWRTLYAKVRTQYQIDLETEDKQDGKQWQCAITFHISSGTDKKTGESCYPKVGCGINLFKLKHDLNVNEENWAEVLALIAASYEGDESMHCCSFNLWFADVAPCVAAQKKVAEADVDAKALEKTDAKGDGNPSHELVVTDQDQGFHACTFDGPPPSEASMKRLEKSRRRARMFRRVFCLGE